jgi:nucleotide-binding universal stress UspA family protein
VRGLSHADVARIREQTEDWNREYLERIAQTTRRPGLRVQTATIEGRPSAAILFYAEQHEVDLIVICTRGGSGVSRWLMGSVADRVVRGATIPVLLVQAQREEANEP